LSRLLLCTKLYKQLRFFVLLNLSNGMLFYTFFRINFFIKTIFFMPRNTATKTAAKGTGTAGKAGSKTAGKSAGKASSKMSNQTSAKTAGRTTGATPQRRSGATAQKSDETMLHELFLDELKDIYWAEKHLTKALPKMRKGATSQELANAFEQHLGETEEQIRRIEEVFDMLEMSPKAKKCEAMDGLVREAQQLMEELPKGSKVRDAGLIIAAQKVEHYEIAAYGSLVQLAKTMGKQDIANVLAQTLSEEKSTDEKLTQLAESGINIAAENETPEDVQ
jgi:ferritin-like metal-binding protein YciE